MERMLTLMMERPVATGAGAVGMLCLAVYPMFRARPMMLTTYLGNNLAFALHYALLGHGTAMMMNAVMGVQTVAAIGLVRRPGLRWMYYAIIPLLLGMAAMTWQGWPSLLSGTATAFSVLGRMQRDETALRVLMLASAPLWAGHDLLTGSLPGLLADLSCIGTGAWMLLRQLHAVAAGGQKPPTNP